MLDRLKRLALGLAALAALAGGGAVIAGADGGKGGKGDDGARAEKSVQERDDDGDRDDAKSGRDEQDEDEGKDDREDKDADEAKDERDDKGEASDDEGDRKPSSSATARAKQAALAATGGGKVNGVELDNERGARYEVEVAKRDGSTVDVRLDGAFKVVATDADTGG